VIVVEGNAVVALAGDRAAGHLDGGSAVAHRDGIAATIP